MVLKKAASNVCSLWWASHVRTKQSKWLDANVQEMEEKVTSIIKLIDEDGDSFAKKAELYFRRRPELINRVEEVFRAYKALADKYDRISGELHKANHTLATAFPDQLPLAMDEDDGMTPRAPGSVDPNQPRKPFDSPQIVLKNKKTDDANKEGEVKAAYQVSRKDDGQVQALLEELVDAPDLKGLLLDVEGRDKILLAEYSSILFTYESTKQKLSELEKNRDHDSEVMTQLKEMKVANAMKDEEIRILREIVSSLQTNKKGNASHGNEDTEERVVYPISNPNSPKIPGPDENTKVGHPQTYLTAEEKFRAEFDALLYENLDYCLRFSKFYDEIQKILKTFKELQTEIFKLEKGKLQDASGTESLKQDSARLEKRLRELNTDVQDCLEKNSRLKSELHCRFTSLGSIVNEISRISESSKSDENGQITPHQAARFQGEVLNMKLETKKVDKDLQDCMGHVRGLQVDIAKTLSKLHQDFELSASSDQNKPRIPLSTFLSGVKLPKKRSSIFARISNSKLLRNLRSASATRK